MLFLILLSTSLGIWATMDLLESDGTSEAADEGGTPNSDDSDRGTTQSSGSTSELSGGAQIEQPPNQTTNTTTGSPLNHVDAGLDSGDNFLRLDDVDNLVGYDDLFVRDYVDMRGDDTIIGGFGEDLIVDGSGVDSISGGLGGDSIFTVEVDDDRFDGSDIVDGGMGDDYLMFDNGDTVTGGHGSDAFVSDANPYDPDYEPPVITDFNRIDDTIEIWVFTFNPSAGIDQARLDTKLDFNADQTLIYVDDNVVAKLDGLHTGIGDRITLTPW